MRECHCTDCGASLAEDTPGGSTCPHCGSTQQTVIIGTGDLFSVRAVMDVKLTGRSAETYRGKSRKKRHRKEFMLDIGRNAQGIRCRSHRAFDRTADTYEEIVQEEETGFLVYAIREPLSCHRGRGAVKKMNFRDAYSWALESMCPSERPS